MKSFMGNQFMLNNETARYLYHNFASKLPIIDYHCHVNPQEIAANRQYSNITEVWIGGDHYKWRAMRSCGIDEALITGNASDYEKFCAYAKIMPRLIGNPLYHWSHLELQRYFDYYGILNADTADEVWNICNEKLSQPDMYVRNIIKKSHVELLCTTDDPADTLSAHEQLSKDSTFSTRVLPAFRPDKAMNAERSDYLDYLQKLSAASGVEIHSLQTLKEALSARIAYFDTHGCKTADHGMDGQIFFALPNTPDMPEKVFERILSKKEVSAHELAVLKTELYRYCAEEYTARRWVMQIHFGVLRNPNTVMHRQLGPDTGYDTIGGGSSITDLASLLNLMTASNALPRTILYSINPNDNAAIGTLIGSFQMSDGSGMPRVMQGSAWWFNDNMTGMIEQMTTLANLSAFGNFLGMLTDSRSFLSYTRHEYFRRILCDRIGRWVENGEYPDDPDALAQLVIDICYNNTKNFFGF